MLIKSLKTLKLNRLIYRSLSTTNTRLNLNDKVILTDKYDKFTLKRVDLLSNKLADDLLSNYNKRDLNGEKIAVLCSNNYTYLLAVMAIWKANGVPLGLNKNYPTNLIEYFITDSKCKLVINGINEEESSSPTKDTAGLNGLLDKHKVINYKLMESKFYANTAEARNEDSMENFRRLLSQSSKEAMILYTSGTSGPPKGVVLTCSNIKSTCETLINAWKMSSTDSLLHCLPLNHVHGLIYCLLTMLYSGAHVDMLPKFNAELVWSKLLEKDNDINTFMAVPTIYVQLVNYYMNNEQFRIKYPEEYVRWIFKNKVRLVVSGSAPLNVKTHKEWNDITGYEILERYGMTEIGLGLSNPYEQTDGRKRVAGAVGRPYGNTAVRIVEPNDGNDKDHVLVESTPDSDTIHKKDKTLFGELQIKGDMVFREYHEKPAQTKETFSEDGWFKTGRIRIGLVLYFALFNKN